MTAGHFLDLLERYEAFLTEWLSQPQAARHCQSGSTQSLEHLLGMIPKMRGFERQGRWDKCMRWLGFMQGVFNCEGIYSLDELKRHNAPPGTDFSD